LQHPASTRSREVADADHHGFAESSDHGSERGVARRDQTRERLRS
jgi:hypothetical protein